MTPLGIVDVFSLPVSVALGGNISEAICEAELCAQQLVHGAHDVGDYRTRGVEHTPH